MGTEKKLKKKHVVILSVIIIATMIIIIFIVQQFPKAMDTNTIATGYEIIPQEVHFDERFRNTDTYGENLDYTPIVEYNGLIYFSDFKTIWAYNPKTNEKEELNLTQSIRGENAPFMIGIIDDDVYIIVQDGGGIFTYDLNTNRVKTLVNKFVGAHNIQYYKGYFYYENNHDGIEQISYDGKKKSVFREKDANLIYAGEYGLIYDVWATGSDIGTYQMKNNEKTMLTELALSEKQSTDNKIFGRFNQQLMEIDLKTKEVKKIEVGLEILIGESDGIVYYMKQQQKEKNQETIYSYNSKTNQIKIIFENVKLSRIVDFFPKTHELISGSNIYNLKTGETTDIILLDKEILTEPLLYDNTIYCYDLDSKADKYYFVKIPYPYMQEEILCETTDFLFSMHGI